MSVKCVCGRDTNEGDGICVICKMDARINELFKNESVIPAEAGIQKEMDPRLRTSGMTTKTNGGEKMVEGRDYKGHKKCRVEGCNNYAIKDGLCWKHWKEENGGAPYPLKKSKVKSKKEIATHSLSARNDKKEAYIGKRLSVIATKQSLPPGSLSDESTINALINALLEKRKELNIILNMLSEITGRLIPDA
jgi:hypothetical protein